LPEKLLQLVAEYEPSLVKEDDTREFKLIPDLDEYEDLFIDEYLRWIPNLDPHNPVRSETMLRSQFDLNFFTQRLHELDREQFEKLKICELQYKQKLKELEDRACPLKRSGETDLTFTQRCGEWLTTERDNLKTEFETNYKQIEEEYKIIKQGCTQRIDTARKNYEEGKEGWQKSAA
jgi:hypothetical protein